jgi:hypothetical protein
MINPENDQETRELYTLFLNNHIEQQARFARENNIEPIELVLDYTIQRNASLGQHISVRETPRELPNSAVRVGGVSAVVGVR